MQRRTPFGILVLLLGTAACGGDGGGGSDPVTPVRTGTITGAALADGAGVPNAQVALSGGGTQATNASGQFTFSNVAEGSHSLSLTAPAGFELGAGETAAKSVSVTAGQTARVDWSLRKLETDQGAGVDTVRLVGVQFQPQTLTIAPGRTVVWVNTSSTFHTVTPNGHSQWNEAQTSSTGEVLRVTFSQSGSFDYHCEPHLSAGMTGQIRVQ